MSLQTWVLLCNLFPRVFSVFVMAVSQWHGHPRVLDIRIHKTLVMWTSPFRITLAIWVRVRVRARVTGDAHITKVWEWGCPYHCHCGDGRDPLFWKTKEPWDEDALFCSYGLFEKVVVCTDNKPSASLRSVMNNRLCYAHVKHWSFHSMLNQTISRLISDVGAYEVYTYFNKGCFGIWSLEHRI